MSADAAGRPEGEAPGRRETVAAALVSHFSHSLRTPLNAILGYAQILARDSAEPLSVLQKERVERIQQAGWQLAKLIDDLVALARLEADLGGLPAPAADASPSQQRPASAASPQSTEGKPLAGGGA
jgi:signal transduction histidine kinase